MFTVVLSHRYKSALKRLRRHKHFDQRLLEEIVRKIARNENLGQRHQDHQLIGSMKEYRECHIKNDMLLVYQKQNDVLILLLVDIGSHSEVFG